MYEQINTFLQGSLQREENTSLVKYLPAEIRHKIWKEYFDAVPFIDLVKNGLLSLVKERLKTKVFLGGEEICDVYLEMAISTGNLKMVQLLVEEGVFKSSPDYIFRRIINSKTQLEIIDYIHSLISQPLTEPYAALAYELAVLSNRLDIVQFLYSTGYTNIVPYCTAQMTTRVGNLEMLKWFIETCDFQMTPHIIDIACKYGHLHIVKWIHFNHPEIICTKSAMDTACEQGHLEIAKFLHTHRSEGCTTKAMIDACKNGHLEVAIWLHFNRREISDARIDDAFDVSLLKYDVALINFFLRCRKEKCSDAVFNCVALKIRDKHLLLELYNRNSQLSISNHVMEMFSAFGEDDMLKFCSNLEDRKRL